jgi:diguanylate cyclase (GGDEF)-like protein/PAS domain S-box-containing protein
MIEVAVRRGSRRIRSAGPGTRRRGVFAELAAAMALLGVAIGTLFPFFSVLLGVPGVHMLKPTFFVACLIAGLLLAAGNWWVAQRVVGHRLRRLSGRLNTVAADIRQASISGRWSARSTERFTSEADGNDELARTASAFNDLLDTLEEEHRFRSLVQAGADMTCLVDPAGMVTFISASVTDVLGWSPETALGRPLRDLIHPDDVTVIDVEAAGPQIVRVIAADGTWHHLEVTLSNHRDDSRIRTLVVTARDVSERHALQERLAHQARHDQLTGLPNRSALMAAGADLLAGSHHDVPCAVLMLDLDRFKEINDTLGHSYGDRLLEQVGPRLRAHLRDEDMLARLGGDEFAALLPGLSQASASAAAARLLHALREPFTVDGLELDVDASIGIALGDRRSAGMDDLLRQADIAMYAAKQMQSGVEIYTEHADHHDRSRLLLLTQVRRAIADRQFVLHYQPKVSLTDGVARGVEALVRWHHPTRGLLSPGDFIPVVERTGLIHQLTLAILDLALAQARAWLSDGIEVQVAVNLSARNLHHVGLPDQVSEALARYDVPARYLRLEVTESALMTDPERAMKILGRLNELGISLSLDDFGTGYSSMTYLKHLPVDELKVDRSFINELLRNAEDAAIVRAAIDLGHNLGMTVVAEGVEEPEAQRALLAMGCDTAQGYHFARPLPPDDILPYLKAYAGRPQTVR